MAVAARFIQCAQVAQTFLSPELTRSLEATLALTARRFDGPTADGPTPIG